VAVVSDREALRWIIYGLVVLLYAVGADLVLSLRKVEKVEKKPRNSRAIGRGERREP